MTWPNHPLQRTGEQRCFSAEQSHQRLVVRLPLPLSASVSGHLTPSNLQKIHRHAFHGA
jgi:hypothetical protein